MIKDIFVNVSIRYQYKKVGLTLSIFIPSIEPFNYILSRPWLAQIHNLFSNIPWQYANKISIKFAIIFVRLTGIKQCSLSDSGY